MFSERNKVAIIPFIDMANHDLHHTNAEWAGFEATRSNPIGAEAARATQTILPGEEILFNYFAPKTFTEQQRIKAGLQLSRKLITPESFQSGNSGSQNTENELLATTFSFCDPALTGKTDVGLTRSRCEAWRQRMEPYRKMLETRFWPQLNLIKCLHADLCAHAELF